jgi:hypothetical protein
LPLQRPEFWPAGHLQLFRRRIACVAQYAAAILATSKAVEATLRDEMNRLGRADIRILALPFPSPLALSSKTIEPDPGLAGANYFVAVITIEPRKNHLLLLDVWKELAETEAEPPRLVLIGKRGWRHEAVTDQIEQNARLRSLIIEAAGLSDAGLRSLLAGARALLAPSFRRRLWLACRRGVDPPRAGHSFRHSRLSRSLPATRNVSRSERCRGLARCGHGAVAKLVAPRARVSRSGQRLRADERRSLFRRSRSVFGDTLKRRFLEGGPMRHSAIPNRRALKVSSTCRWRATI